jgi:hypothetical protein
MPLPALLRQSLALCNRLGRPVTAGVFILGALFIGLQIFAWMQAEPVLQHQIQTIVGEKRWTELQTALSGSGAAGISVDQLATTLTTELETKINAMTDSEKGAYLQGIANDLVRGAGAGLWLTLIALCVVFIYSRAYFLTLMSRKTESIGGAFTQSVISFPHFLLAWILVGLASCIWLPFAIATAGFLQPGILFFALPSLIVPILLVPRFIIAPVLVLQKKMPLMKSLYQSYAQTQGKWWQVLSSLVSISVTVWIVMTVLQTFLQMLVSLTLSYSFFGILIYALTPFLSLIAVAYRSAGLVVVKDGLHSAE